MNIKHIFSAITGLLLGILIAYIISASGRGEPELASEHQQDLGVTDDAAFPDWRALKRTFEQVDPSHFGREFDAIYADDKPGKLYHCQLCLEAWLKVDPTRALEAALAKHRQHMLPDALLALRAVGGPFHEQILAFWNAEGNQYSPDFAAVVRDICEPFPIDAARMELICLLGGEKGQEIANAMVAAGAFTNALDVMRSEGLPNDDRMMGVLGRLYAEEIMEGGELGLGSLSEEAELALQKSVITAMGGNKPEDTLQFAALQDRKFQNGNYSLAIATAVSADPAAVEHWVFQQRDDRLLAYHGVSQMFAYHASRGDADASRRILERYQSEFPGNRLNSKILVEAARQNPEAFVPILQSTHPSVLNNERALIRDFADTNPEGAHAALEYAKSIGYGQVWGLALAQAEFGDDYQGLVSHLADNRFSESAIAVALADVSSENPHQVWETALAIPDPEIKGMAITALIPKVLPISQEWALEAVQTLPDSPGKSMAMSNLGDAFGRMDPRRGSEVLQEWQANGMLNDQFVDAYVRAAAGVDWRGALAWSDEVHDPTMRDSLAKFFKKSEIIPDEEVLRYFP